MLNDNAVLVDTNAGYSISTLLREISPLWDVSSALMALAAASAILAIVLTVIRGSLDVDDRDGKIIETISSVVRVLVFVAILASLGPVANWILDGAGADSHLKFVLSKVS